MITKNERVILYLLSQTKNLTKLKLVKLMFLLSRERTLYDFVPYLYGPFSFQMYQDLRHLEKNGHISQTDDEVHFIEQIFPQPESSIKKTVQACLNHFGDLSEDNLIDYVYRTYPEKTIFSKIRKMEHYCRDETGITTIGYEGKNIDKFLSLLIENKIQTLIDVRKNSYSMKYGFSKNQLNSTLEKLGISFLHIPQLGIESEQRQNLTRSGFEKLFKEYAQTLGEKQEYLNTVTTISQQRKVVLMCFEAQPSDCHRGVIAERLRNEGHSVIDL
jgi:uncharacterized protein (DUF488 family)